MKEQALQLAIEIHAFIAKYAKIKADYDPDYEDEEDRFNGPDSSGMEVAAKSLEKGLVPSHPASSWASGCYKMNLDQGEGFKIHEDLSERINFFVHRGFI